MDEVLDGRSWVVRVYEIEGAGHRLEAGGVVVHIPWCVGCCVRALIFCSHGGRLDSVKKM